MVYIDKVHYEKDSNGNELYISKMKWTNVLSQSATKECTKAELISYINQYSGQVRTKYYKYGIWWNGEEIHVVDNKYLRTDSNNIRADNLGNLPRYQFEGVGFYLTTSLYTED